MLWLVSLASSKKNEVKGLTNKLYAYICTSLEENWFTCKISGSLVLWLVCLDMDLVCIIMYCQDTILKEVKGLMNELYAYALVRKKTGLLAKFQGHWCYG